MVLMKSIFYNFWTGTERKKGSTGVHYPDQ